MDTSRPAGLPRVLEHLETVGEIDEEDVVLVLEVLVWKDSAVHDDLFGAEATV